MSKLSLECEELLNKALNKEKLTEKEWKELIWEIQDIAIDVEENIEAYDDWVHPKTYYFQYKGKFYGIWYYVGNTEYQEDSFDDSNVFEAHKATKTIEVWEPVQNDK